MKRVTLQHAFVLHTRPFRDTSLLVELFTEDYGRICAVARGVKKAKNRGLLLPFVPLLVSWSGRGDLVSLSCIEGADRGYELFGNGLLSGLYVNELLVKLLHQHDAHAQLFHDYQWVLNELQSKANLQAALRIFEKRLLAEIGYGMELTRSVDGVAVAVEGYYHYESEHGFIRCQKENGGELISGRTLLALASESLDSDVVLREAKLLMRLLLNFLLRDRPIRSRELF